MNNIEIIGTFEWGTVRIHNNRTATVERTGHINKAQLIAALADAGYRLASAGRPVNAPHIKASAYKVTAA